MNYLQGLWQKIKPPKAYSWKWLLIWSWFSFGVAALTPAIWPGRVIAFLGWFLGLLAVIWVCVEEHIGLMPWIAACIVNLFLWQQWQIHDGAILLSLYPWWVVFFLVVPKWLDNKLHFQIPPLETRYWSLILIGVHGVLWIWIQIFLTLSFWVQSYPMVLWDDFSRSPGVWRWPAQVDPDRPAVEQVFTQTIAIWQDQLRRGSWDGAGETLSLDLVTLMAELVVQQGQREPERREWQMWLPEVKINASQYEGEPAWVARLTLKWRGPVAQPPPTDTTFPYRVEQDCRLLSNRVLILGDRAIQCGEPKWSGWPRLTPRPASPPSQTPESG